MNSANQSYNDLSILDNNNNINGSFNGRNSLYGLGGSLNYIGTPVHNNYSGSLSF